MSRFILIIALIVSGVMGGWVSPAGAYREYFTPEQKAQLDKIQVVLVELLALTDKGGGDSGSLASVVSRRLSEIGYTVVQDTSEPHDAVVRVKCEQRKTWEGTTASGGDADLPDAPSRLWKGPACQLTYQLGGMKVKWQKEVRTEFEDAVAAAKVIADFAKGNDKLVIKAGAYAGKALDVDGVKALASVPSREVLLSQIAGLLKSPVQRTAAVLAALAQQKGGGAEAPAEAAAA